MFNPSALSQGKGEAAPNSTSQKGERITYHHQISDESSDEEEQNGPSAARPSSGPSSPRNAISIQMSESEEDLEEEERQGLGRATEPPSTTTPVSSSTLLQTDNPSPAAPRPSCPYGARCYRCVCVCYLSDLTFL